MLFFKKIAVINKACGGALELKFCPLSKHNKKNRISKAELLRLNAL
jgi:hypothetical protein